MSKGKTPALLARDPAIDRVRAVLAGVAEGYLERQTQVEILGLAAVTRQHLDLRGPPGTAKSALIAEFASRLDARVFSVLLSPYSTRDELEGPVSLSALSADRYERVTAGRLPECEFAFLDECYKAPPELRNALLRLINERTYRFNGEERPIPLLTVAVASNEGPEEGASSPFADRFLFRSVVRPLESTDSFRALLKGRDAAAENPARASLDDLAAAHTAATRVKIPRPVLAALVQIRKDLLTEGVTLTDRRWQWTAATRSMRGAPLASAVQARALLRGRDAATTADLDVLSWIAWAEPDQIPAVEGVLAQHVASSQRDAEALLERARELVRAWSTSGDNQQIGVESVAELKRLGTELGGYEHDDAVSSEWLVSALREVKASRLQVLAEMFPDEESGAGEGS